MISLPIGIFLTPALVAALIAMSTARPLLHRPSLRAVNWRGYTIPRGYGISFPLAQGLALLSWWILGADVAGLLLPSFALWAMAGIGLMDDLTGESPGGGFRRHLAAFLREGRATVGFLKALLGGILCLAVGISLAGIPWGALDGLLLALFSNAFNLLDVRPGRAAKAGFAIYLVSLVVVPAAALPYLPLLLAAALFFHADCRGRVMMGDVGAYPLGFAIGLGLLSLSVPFKGALCCIVGAFHLYCEVRSVSVAIERNRFLKWIDTWWVRN